MDLGRDQAAASDELAARPARRLVWAARLGILAAFVDLFAQFPVVAPYARDLGAGPTAVGVVVAAHSVANLLGNLGAAVTMDRLGRASSLVLGLLVAAGAVALYGMAQDPVALVALRAVHGLAAGFLTPGAFALLGDAAPAAGRARAMASGGALIALAAVAAPPLAGLGRDRVGAAVVFLVVAAVLALAAMLVGVLAGAPAVRRSPRGSASGPPGGSLRRPPLRTACLAALAFTVGLGVLVTHLPILLEARGAGARSSGVAFAVYAAAALLGLAGPASRLADRYGRPKPLAGGLALIGAALLILAAASSLPVVYVGMALFGLGFGLVFPAATALVTDAAASSHRGRAFGIFYAVYSLGVVLGALMSGALGELLGTTSPAPFVVGATCALAAVPGVLAARRQRPEPATG